MITKISWQKNRQQSQFDRGTAKSFAI